MTTELDIYKKNRINEIQNIYNTNVARLYSDLANNIKNIQSTRLISQSVKQRNINNLITQYNTNVNTLKNSLTQAITTLQNFKPKQLIISNNNNNKKALLIGINYTGTQNELYGCINDVNCIKDKISKQGFTDNNVKIMTDLTSKKATQANILEEFKNLLINSQAGDFLFFLYSGHGSYTLDRNKDETNSYDEMIIGCDLQGILDDDLKSLIQTYLKADITLFALFDSCFSGSVLDLKYQYLDSLNYDKYTENPKQLETLGNVIMISGCTDNQTSTDAFINNQANGAMTWSLLEALKQKPGCSWRELIKTMRDLLKKSQYSQIPQFSSGLFVNIDATVFI
uniref:Peptidase C14 caspase domain-containing protein n=1 Tax=viral metagenome TaxID=1070528 RepID=A0A6C0IHP7_9ZZZZ